MGVDGLNTTLKCQYSKDTGHKLDSCKQHQCKLANDHTAMQGIVTEESLKSNHP